METGYGYQQQTKQVWDKARTKVFWTKLGAKLAGEQSSLLNFDDVEQQFHLKAARYRGVQTIPVENIVGSVGRYQDFTRSFLPTTTAMKERWQGVAGLFLNPVGRSVPPIDVFKVGDAYFVKDGNHRVSVANQIKAVDIEAQVWEYPQEVYGLEAGHSVDEALLETERHAFLEKTDLDRSHPDHNIRLTMAEGYDTLLGQVLYFQYILGQIEDREVSFPEAAAAWYVIHYQPFVQTLEEAGVLELVLANTQADLFLMLASNHTELEHRLGTPVFIARTARNLEETNHQNWLVHSWRLVQRWLKQHIPIA